jgi:hypothetical protein
MRQIGCCWHRYVEVYVACVCFHNVFFLRSPSGKHRRIVCRSVLARYSSPLFLLLPRIVTNYSVSRAEDLRAYDDVMTQAITLQITVGRGQITHPCRVDE